MGRTQSHCATTRVRTWRTVLGVLLLASLVGCASDPGRLPMGATRGEVLERLGTPTGQYWAESAGNTAERLQYSSQPAGQTVFNVDLNAQAQVAAVTQALDEGRFAGIQVDRWTRDDVLREFGRPFEVTRVHAFTGDVWTWRYRTGPLDRLLHIYLDPHGVVRRWHPADEYTNDRDHAR